MSYRIEYSGDAVLDLSTGLALVDWEMQAEAGAIPSLSMVLPPVHPMCDQGAWMLRNASHEVTLTEDGVELFRGRVISAVERDDLCLEIKCEGQIAYLCDTRVRPYATRATNDLAAGTAVIAQDPFEWLVQEHNKHASPDEQFMIGVEPSLRVDRQCTNAPTTWEELNDALCEGQDRYLNVRSGENGERYLDLLEAGVGTTTQVVEFGENLMEYASTREATDMVTAIIARSRGAGSDKEFGLERVADGSYSTQDIIIEVQGDRALSPYLVKEFGIVEEQRTYDAGDVSELIAAVAADLDPDNWRRSTLEYVDVSALDLHTLNPDIQPMRLLESVLVYSKPYGINQWMPVSRVEIKGGDPGGTRYHLGDIRKTLTRQTTLRMGSIRRGMGLLVKRADGAEWDNRRVWQDIDRIDEEAEQDREDTDKKVGEIKDEVDKNQEETNKRIDGLIDGLDRLGDGIVDLEKDFNDDIDGLRELVKAGEEAAGEGLKNLEETLGGRIGDLDEALGRTDSRIEGVESDVSGMNDKVAQASKDAMTALHGSVYYGTCSTGSETVAKVVTGAAAANGNPFTLEKGVMCIITFTEENVALAPTISINGSAARPIKTNGVNVAYWGAGQSVGLMYDGSSWTTPSSPVWATEVTAGNPLGFNFHTNGTEAAMRYGSQKYITANGSGIQVGFTAVSGPTTSVGTRNVYIGSNRLSLRQGQTDFLTLDDTGVQVGIPDRYSNIHVGSDDIIVRDGANRGMTIKGNRLTIDFDKIGQSRISISLGPTYLSSSDSLSITAHSVVRIAGTSLDWNGDRVYMGSLIINPNGETDVYIPASTLGVGADRVFLYSFNVTNGDWNAAQVLVRGASVHGSSLVVHLDRAFTGNMRLNIFGWPSGAEPPTDDPSMPEPPEIGDSPVEGPSFEGAI